MYDYTNLRIATETWPIRNISKWPDSYFRMEIESLYLLLLSCPSFLPALCYLLCPTRSVLLALSHLLCFICFVLPTLSYSLCFTCSVLPALFYLLCPTCSVLSCHAEAYQSVKTAADAYKGRPLRLVKSFPYIVELMSLLRIWLASFVHVRCMCARIERSIASLHLRLC
jgi:hypothetical protein